MSTLTLTVPGPCPHSADGRSHTWQSGDSADLISLGAPDHGVTVYLGQCRYCRVPLLIVTQLSENLRSGGLVLQLHGAQR